MARRILTATVLALLLAISGLVHAAASPQRVDRQAWSRSAAFTTFTPQPGEIYIAISAGIEEARSFVHVDVTGLDEPVLENATLNLHEASDGFMPANATLAVCSLAGPFTTEGQLSGPAPPVDCTLRTTATRDATGAWRVELGIFASRWANRDNFGLALFPDSSQTGSTWRVALATARSDFAAPAEGAPEGSNTFASDFENEPTTAPAETPEAIDLSSPPDEFPALPFSSPPGEPAIGSASTGGAGRGSTTVSAILTSLLVAAATGLVMVARPLWRPLLSSSSRGPGSSQGLGWFPMILVLAVVLLPLAFREVIIYKAGVVLIYFVAAIGLHVLVNWAGQVSLAHASMVGLPAFAVLAISEDHGISAIYLLPVAVLIGVAVGGLVALPTLRAKEIQVALVTLVAGTGLSRFFFGQDWLIGRGGRTASMPPLGPLEFTTSRSLYPLLVVIVAGAVVAAWMLMHSKVARGWYWIQANPSAASTFGIPVVAYRIGAFAVGGAFAGLAGGLAVMWVQHLGHDAFPLTLSFTYLLIAVMAGPGFLGGLAMGAWVLVGGPLFASNIFGVEVGKTLETALAYLGPLALIDIMVRHKAGLNGLGRRIMKRISAATDTKRRRPRADRLQAERPSFSLTLGVSAIVTGFVAIGLAWRHISQTDQLWVQNQELLSGGIGGLGLILVGVGLLIRDRLGRNHALLASQLETLLGGRETPNQPAHDGGSEVLESALSEQDTGDVVMGPSGQAASVDHAPRERSKAVK